MARILVVLLAILVLPGCATRPERVELSPQSPSHWVAYQDWERGFAIDAPGRFEIRPATFAQFGVMRPQSYTLDRGTLRFSVVAVQRRRTDDRHHFDIARDNGFDLASWDRIKSVLPTYQRHVLIDGTLYRQRVVFANRMVYELLVSGPAGVFPDFAARRFFDSFAVMVKT
jgi:hypothetical protein